MATSRARMGAIREASASLVDWREAGSGAIDGGSCNLRARMQRRGARASQDDDRRHLVDERSSGDDGGLG
jgi:hypothetical protein